MALRILITGAGGFTGRALSSFAQTQGAVVYGLDRAAATVEGVTLIQGDLGEAPCVAAAVAASAPDYVVHLAAQTPANVSGISDREWLTTNPLWTLHLLEAVRTGRPTAGVLIVSSSAVYGGATSDEPIVEETPLRPATLYGVSKATQELLATRYATEYGLRVCCARPFNLVGPGEPRRMLTSTLAAQVLAIAAGQAPPVVQMRHRATSRDFTDIRDAVRAYWALLEQGADGAVYNVCSGVATPIGQIVERLLALAGVAARIEETGGGPARGDVLTQRGSSRKLAAATGWRPSIPLDQSLADLLGAWRP